MQTSNDSTVSTVIGPRLEDYELNTEDRVNVQSEVSQKIGLQQASVLGKLPKFRPFKGLRKLVSNASSKGTSGTQNTLSSDMDDTAYTAYTPTDPFRSMAYTPTDTVASGWDTETVSSRHTELCHQSQRHTPLQRIQSLQSQKSISSQKRAERLRARLTPTKSDIYPERPSSSRSMYSQKDGQRFLYSRNDIYQEGSQDSLTERDANRNSIAVTERSVSFLNLSKLDEDTECGDIVYPTSEKGSSSPQFFSPIMYSNVKDYLSQPVFKGMTIQCYIVRSKLRKGVPSTYSLYMEDCGKKLLKATKKRKVLSIDVHGSKVQDSSTSFGKLHWSSNGCNCSLFMSDPTSSECRATQELAHVKYYENRGVRYMTTILPKVDCISSERTVIVPQYEKQSCLLDIYHEDNRQSYDDILVLRNKSPSYNELLQIHYLDFKGRAIHPSVKNFQLVSQMDNDYIVLQFGKIGADVFTMDVKWPMSPLQGFGICLSSFGF
eukprot:TRINITY_DN1203_c0_g1_i1.p1 TRINITY_DN1203_c0_g1~~TRINITY_DN1203_c0_g1_i1.p1  ORF type:complete len:491 (-),score=25.99 TRINITY_DN1203_c0_g1_i1:503-1975(-)